MKECSQAGWALHPKNQEISMGIWGIHGDLVGNHGKYWIPSGELTVCNGTIHHFVAGKIHDFNGHFPLLC